MTNKKEVFFKDFLDKLPFFFRNHQIQDLQISDNKEINFSDQMPIYHSEFVECKLSQKPISKILTFDEQKNF
ncbi:hypothetical protein D1816_16910 [Aquimarina sp. AD10]|uniref:Uncharacterized protein n=1 Tax=Aquimarina aggregata TaxID=1642818 RepID=A0A162Z974_9FLAO|nr:MULTISPECIES: hypothetical protein [Aquimarina]AXT61964.1 hypothetical protein D1816_16910 [Aquimarina sp. AD10]KZS39639.1 hypothetical protein AWE51_08285 [Aquimarina aggregata]RKN02424.1 hypothetical protein D7033_01025 [Aquimarina sp. AD10]